MLVGAAHPLLAPPPPRALALAGPALRWAARATLRARWAGGRLDLALPDRTRVALGGRGPAEATIEIHDDRAFARLLHRGELGAGEAFVAGEWSSPDLVAALRVVLRGTRARGLESPLTWWGQRPTRHHHRAAANTPAGSARNIHAHYDLGNAFYQQFLDPETLAYSCALWSTGAPDLAAAQTAKLEQLCTTLALGPRDHLLDLGCGWGGMAIHAARTRGCRVTAITISAAQHELACARVAAAGLADRISVRRCDYRALPAGDFTKLVSIEMLEAVGAAFIPTYFATIARALPAGGRAAVQTITMPDARFATYARRVDWMQTYVFPGSLIPAPGVIERAAAGAGLAVAAVREIGPDYAPTLRAWRERFVAALPAIRALGFDAPFERTWLLYLAFSEAAFAERTLGVRQYLFTSGG